MTTRCYEYATAGNEGSELLRGMMWISADGYVKRECTHHAKNESEAIPAESLAERSREKMNEQCVRMILVSDLNQSLLSHCLSAFSSVLAEMPTGVVRDQVAVRRALGEALKRR